MATLVLFSGVPGVGKSTLSYRLATETGWALIPRDQIDRSLEQEQVFNGRASYEVMFGLARLNLQRNVSVILDAVFTVAPLRETAMAIAHETHARFFAIVSTCSDLATWERRVANRPAVVDGWTPANWEEVQRVQTRFQPWQSPHLLVDAIRPIEENYSTLLDYIGHKR